MAAGVVCGLIAGNRPADVILAAMLGAYGLFWAGRRDRAALLMAGAAVSAGPVLLYNVGVVGHLVGGYGQVGDVSFFQHDLLAGFAGLLFSPTRGLFAFSPFLLFLVLAWRYLPRDRAERGLTLTICAAVVLQISLYAATDWRAGMSYGPRFLTDLLPMLMWMLVPVVAALRGFGRACFVSAVGVGVVIQAIGACCYTGVTDAAIYAVRNGPHQLRAAWDWRNAPFIASLQQGLAPAELSFVMRGSLDAIEANGRATTVVTAGEQIVATGWALAGQATPLQVAVIIDKRPAVSRVFDDRPDVRAMVPHASRAGWRIPLSTAGLAPGEHRLAVFAWASEKGGTYYLAERKLTVRTPEDLGESFKKAAAQIRAHQQAPGYWLTAYTSATRFQDPKQEMNTFLTSLLIDLLDPLATRANLGDSLQRARQHLTEQIEADGLVRYHGRPDAPNLSKLGCVISPDADDTALVWRIAPASAPTPLAVLEKYRTSEGLYRTWLAAREAYQCIDPGKDPNPTDIAIQMHVLQLLAKQQPPAARALCGALRQAVDQDRIWVYYRLAPLIPILRLNDLQRAGCTLELPESRMHTSVPGQEVWVSLVRLLQRLGRTASRGGVLADAAQIKEIDSVLRQLARDDFALLRRSPPLLYHNDLTATTSRYYWSEDVGYALWLKLAYVHEQFGHASVD
jgi:hypothetical protein